MSKSQLKRVAVQKSKMVTQKREIGIYDFVGPASDAILMLQAQVNRLPEEYRASAKFDVSYNYDERNLEISWERPETELETRMRIESEHRAELADEDRAARELKRIAKEFPHLLEKK